MRVNILTQPLFSNYGGILQNYALQNALRRLGHEPLTLNRPTSRPSKGVLWKEAVRMVLNSVKALRGLWPYPWLWSDTVRMKEHELSHPQRRFVDRYIAKVDVEAPYTQTVAEAYPAEAYVVGSDQVWRPWCSPYMGNCFLDFTEGLDVKRIAYAASFGTDQWEMDRETTAEARWLAQRFDAISVRESTGVDLCRDHLGVEAQHVLDPTMLLTGDDYLALTYDADYPSGPYIAAYILDLDSDKLKYIKALSKRLGLPVVYVGRMHRDGFDSIERWLATLAHAEYTVTDSFHGTVFSILFGRRFFVLGNNVRGNARLESLLSMLGIKADAEGMCQVTPDVQRRLASLRTNSIDFLRENLRR